jgi:hypothetical protein
MENEERTRKKLKHIAAGHKASETKGPAERSRAAKAAAWTKKHGKDNAQNPFARKPPPPRSSLLGGPSSRANLRPALRQEVIKRHAKGIYGPRYEVVLRVSQTTPSR